MHIVYKITNKLNGKIYVGITSLDLKTRWYGHIKSKRSEMPLHQDIRTFGAESFSIASIKTFKTRAAALKAEMEWTQKLNSYFPNGYNIMGSEYTTKPPDSYIKIYLHLKKDTYKSILKAAKVNRNSLKGCLESHIELNKDYILNETLKTTF